MKLRLLSTALACMLPLAAFSSNNADRNRHVQWRDLDGTRYRIEIPFNETARLRGRADHDRLEEFIDDTQAAVNEFTYKPLVSYLEDYRKTNQRNHPVRISVTPEGLQARSRDSHLLRVFERKAKELQKQAYRHYFHVPCDELGVPNETQPCVLLNYPALQDRYHQDLSPLAAGFERLFASNGITKARRKVSVLASFVQSIPYETGPGPFRNPFVMLSDGRGDCDERVLLMEILLDHLLPELKTQMVILPLKDNTQHMLMMLALPQRPGDEPMQIGDGEYIPLELTSRARLGRVIGAEVRNSLWDGKAWAIWTP